MSKKDDEVPTLQDNTQEAVDMKGVNIAEKGAGKPQLEKEEREAAKKDAKAAPKGAYICVTGIRSDGKNYKRGDVYDGKLYQDLIDSKVLVTAEAWEKR